MNDMQLEVMGVAVRPTLNLKFYKKFVLLKFYCLLNIHYMNSTFV